MKMKKIGPEGGGVRPKFYYANPPLWKRGKVEELYMSHFSYSYKTELENGISHLISAMA